MRSIRTHISKSTASFSVFFRLVGILLLMVGGASEAAGTLEKIAKSGVITLGYYESSSPFSLLDENKRPAGYSVDICLKVVEAIKRELKRPDIAVKFYPLTAGKNISALVAGEYDLECGSTTNTSERRKSAAFTIPTFIAVITLLVREDSGIKSVYDLSGKTVVTTKGTQSEKLFSELNTSAILRSKIILGNNHAESFSLLESGKANAFVMNDTILSGQRATSKTPNRYVLTRDTLEIAPKSLMMRKDDAALKRIVNSEIHRLITQHEIYAIYRKWFESPIPPQQINLNLPMSYLLRDSFKTPTDYVPD